MTVTEAERRCGFCAKRLPKLNHKQIGSPPKYCVLLHRQYAQQMRYLSSLRSRLQSEHSKV